MRVIIKDLLFPGIDFCLRKRIKLAKKYLRTGSIKTLDAGCGNGAFCFLCYRLGNLVMGIDSNLDNIKRCIEYRDYKNIPNTKVKFMVLDIYNLLELNDTFDQILCFETLEHLLNDRYVLEVFTKLLKPGGIIHLGVPNIGCPDYYGEKISAFEGGSHVRKGYTYSIIEDMLKEFNLEIVKKDGYGGIFTRKVTGLRRRLEKFLPKKSLIRESINVLLFLVLNPFTYLDKFSKSESMSIYIVAQKSIQ